MDEFFWLVLAAVVLTVCLWVWAVYAHSVVLMVLAGVVTAVFVWLGVKVLITLSGE